MHRPRIATESSTRARLLATAWAIWVVLVQALGGTTALVHSHEGSDGHVHFVASQVRETDHGEWHRRAHGDDGHEHGGAVDLADGSLELLLEFPDAPQVGHDAARTTPDVASFALELAWLGAPLAVGGDGCERVGAFARARDPVRPRAGPALSAPLRI